MKRNLILIFGVLALISCKEQVAKFIFDASKVTFQTKYFYNYDSDKLISQIEKFYTVMFGQVVDSMIRQTDFIYNEKGLLIKELSQSDFNENPDITIYDYNEIDSLISQIYITSENDTIFWEVYKYYPDGRKTVFHRFLSVFFDPNQDFSESMGSNMFDTVFYRNEFDYVGNLCSTQRQYDKNGELIKTVNFNYIGNKLIKETHLVYFNDMEMTEMVKFYDYSKSEIKPDFYSLDFKNDTIELCTNEFANGLLSTSTEIYDYGNSINKTFYKAGNIIGMVGINRNMNFKTTASYEYCENGMLKESKSYSEEITRKYK